MAGKGKRGPKFKTRKRSRKRIDREYYQCKKARLWREKLQNSVDKWVLGKDVTSSNIYTYKEYINLIRCRILWYIQRVSSNRLNTSEDT